MTHFSDNLYLGGAPTNVTSQSSGGLGFGPIGRIYVFDEVPLALAANNIAVSQSPAAGAITLTAGAGVTASVVNGQTRYVLDATNTNLARAVRIVSGGDDSGITFTVSGYDIYGAAMTETITGANVGTATGKKAFKSITGVTHTGTVAGTITIGTTDIFGFPVAVTNAGYIIVAKWDSVLAANAGTFVAADATTATATTGDVRGTYAQAGNASNGTRRLVITIALSNLNIGLSQTVVGVKGVAQA